MLIKVSVTTLAVMLATAAVSGAADPPATNSSAAKAPGNLSSLFGDQVVIKAKAFEIKRSQLEEEVIRIKAQLASQGQQLPPDRLALLEQGVLDQMLGLRLLNDKATEADKTAGTELAKKRLKDVKDRLSTDGTDKLFTLRLKAEGLTEDQLLAKWTQQAIAETVVKREIPVTITDEDVKKFYDENPARFEQPEMVRASHILISTRDAQQKELTPEQKAEKKTKIDDLLKRARAGEDFAKLAKENTDDPGSKETGGEYTFPRGRMVPEFEAAAFSLAPGQVSDVVTTQYGYHIIKLNEKLPAKKVELAKVSADVKEGLTQQAIQKKLPDYMKQLKEQAGVQYLDEKLKPVEPDTKSPATPAAK